MKSNTLQIRAFPENVNKALKIKAVRMGVTLRELVIKLLTEGAK
jgi:plasmid stability protein